MILSTESVHLNLALLLIYTVDCCYVVNPRAEIKQSGGGGCSRLKLVDADLLFKLNIFNAVLCHGRNAAATCEQS